MARNGSGTMAVVNTFVAGNTITAAGHNQNNTDIASEITNSVAVDGQSTMTGQFKASNGTAGAPAWTFGSDLDTGGHRIGANSFGLDAGGSTIVVVATNDVQFTLTSSILFPVGTTAQRPTSQVAGRVRYNSTLGLLEFDNGTSWVSGLILPRGHIDGCIISNGTDAVNDIDVAAGVCRDSTNVINITVAAMAGKQLDANWAPGAAAGMRNSAAGIANTTYHVYAVAKADGTQDIYAHTSTTVATVITALQAESGGSAYLYARRIASIVRISNTLVGFIQNGDRFRLVNKASVAQTNPGTSAVTYALAQIPTGVKHRALIWAELRAQTSGNTTNLYVSALDETDEQPSASSATLGMTGPTGFTNNHVGSYMEITTDTSASVRGRLSASGASDVVALFTLGWIDSRGKDA